MTQERTDEDVVRDLLERMKLWVESLNESGTTATARYDEALVSLDRIIARNAELERERRTMDWPERLMRRVAELEALIEDRDEESARVRTILAASEERIEKLRGALALIAGVSVAHTDVGELNTYWLSEVKDIARTALTPEPLPEEAPTP